MVLEFPETIKIFPAGKLSCLIAVVGADGAYNDIRVILPLSDDVTRSHLTEWKVEQKEKLNWFSVLQL